jgi:hypothetical protein
LKPKTGYKVVEYIDDSKYEAAVKGTEHEYNIWQVAHYGNFEDKGYLKYVPGFHIFGTLAGAEADLAGEDEADQKKYRIVKVRYLNELATGAEYRNGKFYKVVVAALMKPEPPTEKLNLHVSFHAKPKRKLPRGK